MRRFNALDLQRLISLLPKLYDVFKYDVFKIGTILTTTLSLLLYNQLAFCRCSVEFALPYPLVRMLVVKHFIAAVVVVSTLGFSPVLASNDVAISKAQDAAKSWLALTDNGKYSQSWDNSASIFKSAITKPNWEKSLKGVRFPLGALKSRKLKSATFTRSLPGVPDGEYVVIQYTTQFEHKLSAIETVTPSLEKDGSWRVAGYFIK